MEATAAAENTKIDESPADTIVHVVGEKSLHNELLVDFMDGELEFDCRFSPNGGLWAALNKFPDRIQLTFLDCNGKTDAAFLNLGDFKQAGQHPCCHPILYNVNPSAAIEMNALKQGVRGILYTDQPIDFFPRAARVVLMGDLWYSRHILVQYIFEKDDAPNLTKEACLILTHREREIVTKLAEGRSNVEIARHFRISPHTVKTHAYNIYKKIRVENRLQASLWLANNT